MERKETLKWAPLWTNMQDLGVFASFDAMLCNMKNRQVRVRLLVITRWGQCWVRGP